jgi:hypothetical protein
MKVVKSLEALLTGAGLDVAEVEPETRSSPSGKLLRVSDGTTQIIVSVSYSGALPAHPNLESRIIIFLPWKWKDYIMRRYPQRGLGMRIRSTLETQRIGRVDFDDLTTRQHLKA